MKNFNWFSSFNVVTNYVYRPINGVCFQKLWRLSFLQLYAIFLFTGVRFSLINTSLLKPNVDLPIDFSFFLLQSACLANFLLVNRTIVFLELFRLFPILWQASMSLDFTSIPTLADTEMTFYSRSLSPTESGIPDTSILFLLPYCSSMFWLISRETTLLSKLLTLSNLIHLS